MIRVGTKSPAIGSGYRRQPRVARCSGQQRRMRSRPRAKLFRALVTRHARMERIGANLLAPPAVPSRVFETHRNLGGEVEPSRPTSRASGRSLAKRHSAAG